MESLEALQKEIEGEGVRLLSINVDRDEERARRIVEEWKLAYPVIHSPEIAHRYFPVLMRPMIWILDKEGRRSPIPHNGYGAQWLARLAPEFAQAGAVREPVPPAAPATK